MWIYWNASQNSLCIWIWHTNFSFWLQLGFMLLALIWQFDFPPFMVLIIAILNDGLSFFFVFFLFPFLNGEGARVCKFCYWYFYCFWWARNYYDDIEGQGETVSSARQLEVGRDFYYRHHFWWLLSNDDSNFLLGGIQDKFLSCKATYLYVIMSLNFCWPGHSCFDLYDITFFIHTCKIFGSAHSLSSNDRLSAWIMSCVYATLSQALSSVTLWKFNPFLIFLHLSLFPLSFYKGIAFLKSYMICSWSY